MVQKLRTFLLLSSRQFICFIFSFHALGIVQHMYKNDSRTKRLTYSPLGDHSIVLLSSALVQSCFISNKNGMCRYFLLCIVCFTVFNDYVTNASLCWLAIIWRTISLDLLAFTHLRMSHQTWNQCFCSIHAHLLGCGRPHVKIRVHVSKLELLTFVLILGLQLKTSTFLLRAR